MKAAVKEQRAVPLIDTRDGSAAFYTGSEGIYVFMKDFLTQNQTILLPPE